MEEDESQSSIKSDSPEIELENPLDKAVKREPRDHRPTEKMMHKNTNILPPIKYKQ